MSSYTAQISPSKIVVFNDSNGYWCFYCTLKYTLLTKLQFQSMGAFSVALLEMIISLVVVSLVKKKTL